MTTAIIIGVAAVLLFLVLNTTVPRSRMKNQGQSRCAFCGKRLKKVTGGYAETCAHCTRVQPWAKNAV